MVLGLLATAAWGQMAEEYHVKAAFLFNFAKFVDWPPQAFKSAADPIAICVVGTNPFGNALEQAVSGHVVEGRSFAVRQISDLQQMGACNMVFVPLSERKRLASIFHEMKTSGVLTVGECDNFTAEGGIINLRIEDGNVRIQINVVAAAQQQIHISSKLLGLAEIVRK
jgi:YfiR/HmsC-like